MHNKHLLFTNVYSALALCLYVFVVCWILHLMICDFLHIASVWLIDNNWPFFLFRFRMIAVEGVCSCVCDFVNEVFFIRNLFFRRFVSVCDHMRVNLTKWLSLVAANSFPVGLAWVVHIGIFFRRLRVLMFDPASPTSTFLFYNFIPAWTCECVCVIVVWDSIWSSLSMEWEPMQKYEWNVQSASLSGLKWTLCGLCDGVCVRRCSRWTLRALP